MTRLSGATAHPHVLTVAQRESPIRGTSLLTYHAPSETFIVPRFVGPGTTWTARNADRNIRTGITPLPSFPLPLIPHFLPNDRSTYPNYVRQHAAA